MFFLMFFKNITASGHYSACVQYINTLSLYIGIRLAVFIWDIDSNVNSGPDFHFSA